jgi:predicted NUDIX family phosphoesterase
VNLDDAHMVNRVHVGFVFVFEGDSLNIHSRERAVKDLGLKTVGELRSFPPQMTSWSQLVYPHLQEIL